jgi:hypothetical protein
MLAFRLLIRLDGFLMVGLRLLGVLQDVKVRAVLEGQGTAKGGLAGADVVFKELASVGSGDLQGATVRGWSISWPHASTAPCWSFSWRLTSVSLSLPLPRAVRRRRPRS